MVRYLAAFGLVSAVFSPWSCHAAVSIQLFGLDRVSGNEVGCLNFAWAEGIESFLWRPLARSSFGCASTTFYSTTWAYGPWGGEAAIQWEKQPSQTDPGTYWGWFLAALEYYCGGWQYRDWNDKVLSVQRPTISGLQGAWYFGNGFIPNNGYYDATRLAADANYPDPGTDPYWIVTANGTKVMLTCTHCTATDVHSKGDTYPCSCSSSVKIRVSVGGQNSFPSDEHWLVIDTPYRLSQYGNEMNNEAAYGDAVGFLSTITYRLYSKCSQQMTSVGLNETLVGTHDDMSNNWGGDPPETNNWDGFTNPGNNTFEDLVGFLCYGCNPAPEFPGYLQSPPKPLSTTKVLHHHQKFRAGSNVTGECVEV
ncbi:MAG: hypothetical protein IT159_12220 [Bryobacterales bacterium]|nr:hypothetical protein [Bryobacterales bacterium]